MRRAVEILLLVALVAVLVPLTRAEPRTCLDLDSPRGEWVGQGRKIRCTDHEHTFVARATSWGGVEVFVRGQAPADYWHLSFAPPRGETLQPGHYADAVRLWHDARSPGLECSGQGRGSNRLAGSFTVLECEVENGELQRFAADFTQRSEGRGEPLRGKVRFRSSR